MTTSIILKFGPGVKPDPTKPFQKHLRKNLGRLPGPVNQKTLIQSVRIVHPGVPPAVLGTCTPSCFTTCLVSCNPFCCNSKAAAGSNMQYSAMRHGVIAQANRRRFIMPGFSRYPVVPLQAMASQARAMTVPVTLAIRCVPTVQRPCPPGTQVSQTVSHF